MGCKHKSFNTLGGWWFWPSTENWGMEGQIDRWRPIGGYFTKRHPGPKNMLANAGDIRDEGEESMATHSSSLAWRIPWREEPGGLWSIGLQRVGHD